MSFRDEWLQAFFVDDKRSRNIPPDLDSRLFRKLQMIDDATTDQDLRVPPSNHFEKLRGDLAGLSLDPRQRSMAADLPVERQPRRGKRRLSRRPQLQNRRNMLAMKRKPATVGEILIEEFMRPMG